MAFLAPIATALSIAGTVVSAIGAIQQGQAAKSAAEFEADQLQKKAMTERAAGQRQMEGEQRKKRLALSSLQARAAAGGGGADDPTVALLAEGIEEEGTLQALERYWIADNRAAGFQDQAKATLMTGKAKANQGYMTAFGGILSGGVSAFEKYSALSSKYG